MWREEGDMLRSTAGGVGVSAQSCGTTCTPEKTHRHACEEDLSPRGSHMGVLAAWFWCSDGELKSRLQTHALLLPECGDPGEAGSMTAVPSSAMRSWRARLGCSGEMGGERAPLSHPFARRGSFRSRGSSRDSMTTNS